MKIYYRSDLKKVAQQLRKNMTLAEVLLWRQLRNKQFFGYDFHRQKPIGDYIVDFCCPRLKLIIEIDGSSHDYKVEDDFKRQKELEKIGFKFLRFKEMEVRYEMDGVLQSVQNFIHEHTPRPSF